MNRDEDVYYSAIGLVALVVLLIENQDIFLYPSDGFNKPEWRVYRRFLFAVLVYYVTDILWGILETNKYGHLLFVDTSVYFVAMAMGVALWTQYIVTYLGEQSLFERLTLIVGRGIAGITALLAIVNVFHPLLFVVDDAGGYHPLGLRYAILAGQIVMLLLISGYALTSLVGRRSTAEGQRRYQTLGCFGLIVGACLTAQLYYPFLPLYSIGYLLGTSLLRSFIIGDEKEAYRQGMEEATRIAELKQSITSLLDNMPSMSFSKDVETGTYLACNQAFAAFACKDSPTGVVGHTDFELFDANTAHHFVEDDQQALAMDRPYVFYEDVQDAEGEPRQFQTTKLKFYDSSGRECLLGMSMDVTEAEQAKAAYLQALGTNTIYENIIGALVGDYFNLFYIDLQTDDYIEYGLRTEEGHQRAEHHGTDFFAAAKRNAQSLVFEDDRDQFVQAVDKEALLHEVDKNGMFLIQYRLMINDKPTYVNLKATRANGDDRHLIVGVNNVDAQVRDRAAAMHAMEERKTYLRLSALNGNLIVLYYVDVETDRYTEFSATKHYDELGIQKQGDEFFGTTYENSLSAVYPEDQQLFHSLMTRENVLRTIEQDGVFVIDYRLMINSEPTYVRLKAAKIDEGGKPMLIVGVLNEDAQIRREQGYVHDLTVAREMATIDALTGVKNKYAYVQWEEQIDAEIGAGEQEPLAVVVCDINNMKAVNDLYGHKEGDACIKRASKRICDTFVHSPVFRVGGDEFVVLLTGEEYDKRDELVARINVLPENLSGVRPGDTLSAGVVACDARVHRSLAAVFEAADKAMYERKHAVKAIFADDAPFQR